MYQTTFDRIRDRLKNELPSQKDTWWQTDIYDKARELADDIFENDELSYARNVHPKNLIDTFGKRIYGRDFIQNVMNACNENGEDKWVPCDENTKTIARDANHWNDKNIFLDSDNSTQKNILSNYIKDALNEYNNRVRSSNKEVSDLYDSTGSKINEFKTTLALEKNRSKHEIDKAHKKLTDLSEILSDKSYAASLSLENKLVENSKNTSVPTFKQLYDHVFSSARFADMMENKAQKQKLGRSKTLQYA